jgi:nitrogen-specific signal transduction histidine kinase
MGGTLELESDRGRTLFRLYLPADERIAAPVPS